MINFMAEFSDKETCLQYLADRKWSAGLVMLGVLMRDPVTTTSWMVESWACAGSATTAAPASSACRTARCKERFGIAIVSLQ